MGGRKASKRKPMQRKPPPPLDTVFTCPFCINERVVTCILCGRPRPLSASGQRLADTPPGRKGEGGGWPAPR